MAADEPLGDFNIPIGDFNIIYSFYAFFELFEWIYAMGCQRCGQT